MAIREWLKRYNADEMLFFFAVLFKPLYILPSGSFQIGDFLFIAAVAVHFLKGSKSDPMMPVHKEEHYLLVFVSGILIINFTYWIFIGTTDFLLNSAYYIFNFLIVLFAADVLQSERKNSFLCGLCISCKIAILFQLILYAIGADNILNGERHMGSFNDPNQYAVYMLFCLFVMLDVYHEVNLKTAFWIAIVTVLIISTGSTGTLLGLAVFLILLLLLTISIIEKRKLKIAVAGIITLLMVFFVILHSSKEVVNMDAFQMMRDRLGEKTSSVSDPGEIMNYLINDRIWNRVFEQPKYLLYGAGEGAHNRFDTLSREVHSSLLGPLFYYGIGIGMFLFSWIIIKLKHADRFQLCIYTAIIVESVLLVNYRQPLFWFLFVLAGREKNEVLTVGRVNKAEHFDSVIFQKISQRI